MALRCGFSRKIRLWPEQTSELRPSLAAKRATGGLGTTYLMRPLPEPLKGSELNCILPMPPATVRLVQASMYLS